EAGERHRERTDQHHPPPASPRQLPGAGRDAPADPRPGQRADGETPQRHRGDPRGAGRRPRRNELRLAPAAEGGLGATLFQAVSAQAETALRSDYLRAARWPSSPRRTTPLSWSRSTSARKARLWALIVRSSRMISVFSSSSASWDGPSGVMI